MKQTVLARPNLKLLLLGAILIAVVEHLVISRDSPGPLVLQARTNATTDPNAYLALLLEEAVRNPTADLYMKISAAYEERGQVKKALVYLRQAERLAQLEDR